MEFYKKIKIIQDKLDISQKDFALKIGVTSNAISQYLNNKRKPDFATIQKLIDIGVSPNFIFSDGNEAFDNEYDLFIIAKKVDDKNKKLFFLLNNYIIEQDILIKINEKIQRAMGRKFVEKITEFVNGDVKRMLILLYSLLLLVEKEKVLLSDKNLNNKLSELFEQISFSTNETLKLGIITNDKDFENLKQWIKNEFDDISIIEFISCSQEIKRLIKKELWKVNKTFIEIVEKKFM